MGPFWKPVIPSILFSETLNIPWAHPLRGMFMAQRLSNKPSIVPERQGSLPKINSFFDGAILIARRTTELVSAVEPAVLRLFLLCHLILDLVIVSVVLWKFG